jgi:hypothetical protein
VVEARRDVREVQTFQDNHIIFEQHKVRRVLFGPECVNRKIIDANEFYATIDEDLSCVGFEICKVFVESAVCPVLRVVRFEQDPLNAVKA